MLLLLLVLDSTMREMSAITLLLVVGVLLLLLIVEVAVVDGFNAINPRIVTPTTAATTTTITNHLFQRHHDHHRHHQPRRRGCCCFFKSDWGCSSRYSSSLARTTASSFFSSGVTADVTEEGVAEATTYTNIDDTVKDGTSTTSATKPPRRRRTPFEQYNVYDKKRIEESYDDYLNLDDDEDISTSSCGSRNVRKAVAETSAAGTANSLPIISWKQIQQSQLQLQRQLQLTSTSSLLKMTTAGNDDDDDDNGDHEEVLVVEVRDSEEKDGNDKSLQDLFRLNGGYVIVDLLYQQENNENDEDSFKNEQHDIQSQRQRPQQQEEQQQEEDPISIIENMWNSIKQFYDILDDNTTTSVDGNGSGIIMNDEMRQKYIGHQTLIRKQRQRQRVQTSRTNDITDIDEEYDTSSSSYDEEKEEEEEMNTGYKFVQTYINKTCSGGGGGDVVVVPTIIQDTITSYIEKAMGVTKKKMSSSDNFGIEESFVLLAKLAEQVATTALLLSTSTTSPSTCNTTTNSNKMKENLTSIIDEMIHTNAAKYANSNHRLARYVVDVDNRQVDAEQQQHSSMSTTTTTSTTSTTNATTSTTRSSSPSKESLRSHTDWTICTCIPCSSIPGLQIYNPITKQWICIEEEILLLSLGCRDNSHYAEGEGENTNDTNNMKTNNSRYVIVMAGKYLELLTNGTIPACIHRVVVEVVTKNCESDVPSKTTAKATANGTKQNEEARLSAPFFLRPTETTFERMMVCCNNSNNVTTMHQKCYTENSSLQDSIHDIYQDMFS